MVKAIMQGDQYGLPISIRKNDTIVNDNVDEMIIKVGKVQKDKSELTFTENMWFFPLTEEQTYSIRGMVEIQARFRIGSEWYGTNIEKMRVNTSIIEEE